ncbi:transmembrane protein [Dictyostelium discoideum AX4]|uniref:ER membrane protein complex subunit 6 n=1 Tax=Dictyostelium discoideum TaxID=44689 RepID=EMC6_DICDI|nr:transmembrane protein [Dictyostelium discoideum AX4]Q1ZXH4.1 RecName: Full=ER membrane protein complex subunit 6; AltName: Full=Transmembrane protein 93 [Dictyostelium discoideum]EAS66878.1 transmembrane protein [Dictyostelium discoideum AX4]|eukprot:XP_001134562.1 transmembrane protein [Dictyostelium discoideum AX4]
MLHPQQMQEQQQQQQEAQAASIIPEHYEMEYIQRNNKTVSFCQIPISILGGAIAGVIGFSGVYGFLFYFFIYITFCSLFTLKENKNLHLYFPNPRSIWFDSIGAGLMPYILFWTFLYNIIHIY